MVSLTTLFSFLLLIIVSLSICLSVSLYAYHLLFTYFIYLFYIPTAVSPPSSPPNFSPSPLLHLLSCPFSLNLSQFLFRKAQTSHEYPTAMTYQVAIRLGTSFSTRARRIIPVGGKGMHQSQRQALLSLLSIP